MKGIKNISNIIIGVNIVTLVLYLFPPVFKTSANRGLVFLYLVISILLMYLGMRSGYKKGIRNKQGFKIWYPSSRFLNFVMVFYSATFLLRYGYLMGLSPFDFQGMVTRVAIGLADPALGYQMALNEGISPVPWSVFFLISIVNDMFFIIHFCYWKQLNTFKKTLVIVYVIIELLYWFGRGTNFGIITMITNVLFVHFIVGDYRERAGKRSKEWKKTLKNIIVIGVSLTLVIVVFSYLMVGRTGKGDSSQSLKNIESTQQINYNSFVVSNLPDELIAPYYFIYSYMCQGYDNLGKAMNCDFHWTFMMGNNPRLMSLSSAIFHYQPFKFSYMNELEKEYGVDSYASWHSAYLWWANDVTIPGVLLVVYMIAHYCGYAIVLAIRNRDFFSQLVSVALCNILLYMFANNTYLALMFYSFMLLFPYWLYTRYTK